MIYIARHGESDANLKKIHSGNRIDSPLTAKGIGQAYQLADCAAELGIDLIVSSPLSRSLDTAKIVKEVIGLEAEIVLERGIEEYDFGELTGQSSGRPSAEVFAAKGAEKPEDFVRRALEAIVKWSEAGNVLFISHNGVVWAVQTAEKGLSANQFRDQDSIVSNAKISEIDLDAITRYLE